MLEFIIVTILMSKGNKKEASQVLNTYIVTIQKYSVHVYKLSKCKWLVMFDKEWKRDFEKLCSAYHELRITSLHIKVEPGVIEILIIMIIVMRIYPQFASTLVRRSLIHRTKKVHLTLLLMGLFQTSTQCIILLLFLVFSQIKIGGAL